MSHQIEHALVTGGAGFIGSHIVDALVADGCRVTVLDNLSTGSELNLAAVRDHITFYNGDIRDRRLLEKAAEGWGDSSDGFARRWKCAATRFQGTAAR